MLIILSGSALFTEINVPLAEMFLSRPRDHCRRRWRFWVIVYLGNAAGALFVGPVIKGARRLRAMIIFQPPAVLTLERCGDGGPTSSS